VFSNSLGSGALLELLHVIFLIQRIDLQLAGDALVGDALVGELTWLSLRPGTLVHARYFWCIGAGRCSALPPGGSYSR